MLIKGLNFEEVRESDLKRNRDYGIVREKGKQCESFVWIDSYSRDFSKNSFCIESHLLTKTSRGSILFDGVKLKDEVDIENGSKIFNSLDFGK